MSHLRSGKLTSDSLRAAQSSPMINRRGRSPLSVQLPQASSPVAGSLEWLWYSPTSMLDQFSGPSTPPPHPRSPPKRDYPEEDGEGASPSPPRLPLRPLRAGRGSLTARSTPLISRRQSRFLSPRSCARDRFMDLQVEETPSPPPQPLTSRPPTPLLLLRRSISPRVKRRASAVAVVEGGLSREFSTSCADLMPSRLALLPPRASAFRAPSDLARKRYRKKLEQHQQEQPQQPHQEEMGEI